MPPAAGLLAIDASGFERTVLLTPNMGWEVDVFGMPILDTVLRNQQVRHEPSQACCGSPNMPIIAKQISCKCGVQCTFAAAADAVASNTASHCLYEIRATPPDSQPCCELRRCRGGCAPSGIC